MAKLMLFLSPHPDDHLMSAGLMSKLRKIGWDIGEVLFTDGSRGGDLKMKERRRQEHDQACKLLGISKLHRYEQVNRSDWERLFDVQSLAKILQEWKPTLVVMPHPEDYHLEHQMVSRLGMAAVRSAFIYRFSEMKLRVPIVMFPLGLLPRTPSVVFDVSEEYEVKLELAKIYEKEMTPALEQWLEGESGYWGFVTNSPRAEPYLFPEGWIPDMSQLL